MNAKQEHRSEKLLQLAVWKSGVNTDPAALAFSTSYLNSDVPIAEYAKFTRW